MAGRAVVSRPPRARGEGIQRTIPPSVSLSRNAPTRHLMYSRSAFSARFLPVAILARAVRPSPLVTTRLRPRSRIFAKVQPGWSPNREDRPQNMGEMDKVMGGAYVLNYSGMMATIAFCFEDERRTGVFGLTVAQLVRGIGETVYMLDHKVNPQTGKHTIKRIGEVVEISHATDSMVFKLDQARPAPTHPSPSHSQNEPHNANRAWSVRFSWLCHPQGCARSSSFGSRSPQAALPARPIA